MLIGTSQQVSQLSIGMRDAGGIVLFSRAEIDVRGLSWGVHTRTLCGDMTEVAPNVRVVRQRAIRVESEKLCDRVTSKML
jgi:hypothetical protein